MDDSHVTAAGVKAYRSYCDYSDGTGCCLNQVKRLYLYKFASSKKKVISHNHDDDAAKGANQQSFVL